MEYLVFNGWNTLYLMDGIPSFYVILTFYMSF